MKSWNGYRSLHQGQFMEHRKHRQGNKKVSRKRKEEIRHETILSDTDDPGEHGRGVGGEQRRSGGRPDPPLGAIRTSNRPLNTNASGSWA